MCKVISNSYTMGCPPVRGDNPRALASGLSYEQVDNPWYNYFYTTYISVELAHQVIFHAKVGKGGVRLVFREGSIQPVQQKRQARFILYYIQFKTANNKGVYQSV